MFDDLRALSDAAIAAETPRTQTRIVVVGLLTISGIWMAVLAAAPLWNWWSKGVPLDLRPALTPLAPSSIFIFGFLLWRIRGRRKPRAPAAPPLQLD